MPALFALVPRNAIGKETPLELAGADEMDFLPEPKIEMEVNGEGVKCRSKTDETKVYTCMRHSENSYSCNCLSWTFQRKRAVDVRSCKHLRELLGDEHEDARTGDSGRAKGKAKKAAAAPAPEEPKTYAAPGSKKRAVSMPKGPKAKKAKKAAAAVREELEEEDAEDCGEGPAVGLAKKKVVEATQGEPLTDPETSVEEAEMSEVSAKGKGKAKERKGGMELLLANKFEIDGKKDPTGWWISEKLDGIRAYWDGQSTLWSRMGNAFVAPESFLKHLPKGTTLDGELFLGRDRFDETSGLVRTTIEGADWEKRWEEMRFMVFDIPSLADSPFEERQAALQSLFPVAPISTATASSVIDVAPVTRSKGKAKAAERDNVVRVVEQERCEGKEHLLRRLKEVAELGGEGLMLRQPQSRYIPKRSTTLLKVKTFHDAEARVIGHEPGKGKYEGMCGALSCVMESGTVFSVGSGLSDERRRDPPGIGAIVTYRFFELTKAGVPRFPTFVGERFDVEGPKDAVLPAKGGGEDA
ncbi:hypothetical protein JCM10213_006641 [Rhodosporidiobolus nylandii]